MALIKPKSEITVYCRMEPEDAAKAQGYMQQIMSNLSLEELQLLARATGDLLVKMKAVHELKQHYGL